MPSTRQTILQSLLRFCTSRTGGGRNRGGTTSDCGVSASRWYRPGRQPPGTIRGDFGLEISSIWCRVRFDRFGGGSLWFLAFSATAWVRCGLRNQGQWRAQRCGILTAGGRRRMAPDANEDLDKHDHRYPRCCAACQADIQHSAEWVLDEPLGARPSQARGGSDPDTHSETLAWPRRRTPGGEEIHW
jgi:hypothetical protein